MVRRKNTKTASQETANKQHLMELYDSSEVGMIATMKNGKIGIITEKFLSPGGMPQFWVHEAGHGLVPYCMELIAKVEKKPTAVVLFSGGGGVEAGLMDAGIEPLLAVEYNPDKPDLSEAMSDAHEANFPQCRVIRRTVQELAAEDFPGFPQEPDILWASPMCSNFSAAKKGGTEQDDDVAAAKAVVAAIKKIKPKHFVLENVPAYQKSQSWKQIGFVVPSLGYNLKSTIVDMSDYGVPQARKRFIAWASRDAQPPLELPEKSAKISWYEAIKDLIPSLPDSELLKGQRRSVDKFLENNASEPLLIDRVGVRSRYAAIPSFKPANTILRSHFTDHRNNSRSKFADIWLPDSVSGSDVGASGQVKQVTIECVRRLQSFSDWYEFPEEVGVAGSILGYSVPPKFVELFLKPIGQITPTLTNSNHTAELDESGEIVQEMGCENAMPTIEYQKKELKDWADKVGELVRRIGEWGDDVKESGLSISFGKTYPQLLKGKSVTRRVWKDSHALKFIKIFEEGARFQALDKDKRYGGKQVGWLTLTEKPYQEKLADMPMADLIKEGFPELTLAEFIEHYFDGDDQKVVWVIRFKFEPIESEQKSQDCKSNHALSVQTSSKTDEHYSPDEVKEAAMPAAVREATIATLGTIDLDPCSNSHTAPNIPAANHYTIEDDGLSKSWAIGEGRIYLNPPYSATASWVDKLLEEYLAGGVKEAVVLVKSATDTKWYQKLDQFPKCLWNGRLKFKGNSSSAPFASSVFYLGENFEKFQKAFSKHGRVHGVPQIPQITKSKSQFSFLKSQLLTPTALPIAQIRRDGGTQPREKLDMAHVATLKEAIEEGAELDPADVFYDGENDWLADGFHRCKAYEELGIEDIQVIIHQGTRRDAVLYAAAANADHKAAKPRSRADKRRAVMMLLRDQEWSSWSNYQIARQCKVSEATVRNIRKSLTAKIRSEDKPKTRTYTTKHGTTAAMQVGSIGKGKQETGNGEQETENGETSGLPLADVENSQPLPANNSNGTLPEGNDHSNNGNRHHTSVPKSPPVEDYIIGFTSNIDQMSVEQLVEVRDRIEQRLANLQCPTIPKNGKSTSDLVLVGKN